MRDPTDATRTVGKLARIGLGMGDELGKRSCWNRWMHRHDKTTAHQTRDWSDVVNEIEIEIVVERRINGIRRSGQQERITIRSGAHDRLGGDVAACARPVLDDELLPELLR